MEQSNERGKAIIAVIVLIAWLILSPVTPIPFDGVAAAVLLVLEGRKALHLISEK